jgi:hypothetical protein
LIGGFTTEGEHHCLSKLFADGNIIPDLVAATQKLSVFVDIAITLVSEVGSRPFSHSLGEDVDESNINNIHRSLLAEMAQTRLVGTLAIVNGDISFRINIQGNRVRNER